ncbi:TadE/TadG family type IV pilus assembly protein [Dermatobacter hominis]|uniref:TadE/TadG family type IV pilus assembly protein n=1 Tax=Dermatobacter hominis TaxID=2884263 RepID=UPI001D101828|nr:TadE/TadG family type IV pilus assembly protein [Dermatobacter hominis]UDY34420.1 pilus assembly protein [Dermatobacter hominis]
MTGRAGVCGTRRTERGQATVELALLLPVVVTALLLVVQVGLVVRDRVLVVHAARTAARAVAVDPTPAAARAALDDAGAGDVRVAVRGDRRPGRLATVTVTASPTALPLVGRVLSGVELRERLSVRVEGP